MGRDFLITRIKTATENLIEPTEEGWKVVRIRGRSVDLLNLAARLMLPAFFVIWFLFLSITSPVFLTSRNVFNVTRQVAVIGILSMGQLLCMITGNIDLTVGAFLALFGVVLGELSLSLGPVPAIILSLTMALIWGLINGFLVTRGVGISVIVTLSMMYIARGATLLLTLGKPVILFPIPYAFIGQDDLGPVPWSLITFLGVAIVIYFILQYTPVGRHLYSIGGNREAAKVCGVKVNKVTLGVYVGSALLSALGSIVLIGRIKSAHPNAGYFMELDSIATVLIGGASVSGGRGGVITTIIGIFILGFINNGLNLLGVSSYYQYVLKGFIILLAVMVDQILGKKK
jgi:ribose/xylose/arabinose/galactoside ABC-type transport system permease subunit